MFIPNKNSLLACLRSAEKFSSYITKQLSIIAGSLFFCLGVYLTIDVISRKLGGPFTGVTDEIASYILAFSGTLALAYALVDGHHVRIDVLMNVYSVQVKRILRIGSLFLTMVFSCILTQQMWSLTLDSYSMNAKFPQSMLNVPVAIPQALAAIGLTVLTIEALILFLLNICGIRKGDQ